MLWHSHMTCPLPPPTLPLQRAAVKQAANKTGGFSPKKPPARTADRGDDDTLGGYE